MEVFIFFILSIIFLAVLNLITRENLSSDRRDIKNIFDINIVDPGNVIAEGVFFGAFPFRYARLAHKDLQVAYFTLDKPAASEVVILPNDMRTYLALWVERLDRKNPIWRPNGKASIDMLLTEGLFVWLRGSAALVVFPPSTPPLTHSEVLQKVSVLRGLARGLECPVA